MKNNINRLMDKLQDYLVNNPIFDISKNTLMDGYTIKKDSLNLGHIWFARVYNPGAYGLAESPNIALEGIFINEEFKGNLIAEVILGQLFDFAVKNKVKNLLITKIMKDESKLYGNLSKAERIEIFKKIGKEFGKEGEYNEALNYLIFRI